tara:strand:+ start:70 stop:270 length:201 start_codon:yes stop_codon:yes gene_type:complete
MTQRKSGTHGITARSKLVRIPMENGQVLEIEPKTNLIWLWDRDPYADGSDILKLFYMSDLQKMEVK